MQTERCCRALTLLAAVLAVLLASPAAAQRAAPGVPAAEPKAGTFDYYTLVLSWSPTYCAALRGPDPDPQCREGRAGRPYAFVLHGLWPQYERGFPEHCRTTDRPFVPRPVIDGMLDIMPSPRLVIHEYRRHGTCSGLDPTAYYALSRRLFEKISVPGRFRAPAAPFFVSPHELADEFVRANPGLKFDMLGIECRGSGNRLREVRICFSREGAFRTCGTNELQRKLCPANRMYVPPVRGGGSQPRPLVPGQRAL